MNGVFLKSCKLNIYFELLLLLFLLLLLLISLNEIYIKFLYNYVQKGMAAKWDNRLILCSVKSMYY